MKKNTHLSDVAGAPLSSETHLVSFSFRRENTSWGAGVLTEHSLGFGLSDRCPVLIISGRPSCWVQGFLSRLARCCPGVLARVVSDKEPAALLTSVPLYPACFPLVAFSSFSLPLVFCHLIMRCCGVVFSPWICRFIVYLKSGHFGPWFLQIFLVSSPTLLPRLYWQAWCCPTGPTGTFVFFFQSFSSSCEGESPITTVTTWGNLVASCFPWGHGHPPPKACRSRQCAPTASSSQSHLCSSPHCVIAVHKNIFDGTNSHL